MLDRTRCRAALLRRSVRSLPVPDLGELVYPPLGFEYSRYIERTAADGECRQRPLSVIHTALRPPECRSGAASQASTAVRVVWRIGDPRAANRPWVSPGQSLSPRGQAGVALRRECGFCSFEAAELIKTWPYLHYSYP